MTQIVSLPHKKSAGYALSMLATYKQAEDLIRIGAYQPGSDKNVDQAMQFVPLLEKMMQQEVEVPSSFDDAQKALQILVQPFTKRR